MEEINNNEKQMKNINKRNTFKSKINNEKEIIRKIDSNFLVYNSPYLQKSKINNYNGLCNDLKELEIQLYKKNRIKNSNYLHITDDIEYEIAIMREKSEINDSGYDFNNNEVIFNIIEIIKKDPEKRTMSDLLKIVKYLTTTKLGQYFKDEFEQKEVFEKLITFCGVEIRYKLFKKGETIFKIGELPDYFYMILYGKVEILKPTPKKKLLTGYQYFCYLMDLIKKNENYLFNLCIKENVSDFYIQKDESKDIHYIYLLVLLDQISRHKIVDFATALNITRISIEDLGLDPRQINSNKYLLENIKKIKRRLPDIPGAIIQKYFFFDDRLTKKEVTIFDYLKFLSLEAKAYFGDSAMDSNTTRNATVIAAEDTYVAYISNHLYYKNVVVEKAAIIDKKIRFLNSNFIFGKINAKKFEGKYFSWFICNKYKKGDIIFNEGDIPTNVYFIEQGDVELYSSKNIIEFQKVIDYLEKKKNIILKSKTWEENKDEKNCLHTYDKINFNCMELKNQINKKEKKRIILLKNNEDIGMLSFYFGYPYIYSCVVSSTFAKIYKIDNKYLSDLLMKEKQCYDDLVNRIENKLTLFHERFFNINNTKLLLADHKKMIEFKEKEKNLSNKELSNNNNIYNNAKINNKRPNKTQNDFQCTNNNFNKTNIKINYNKIKEIFNKSFDNNNEQKFKNSLRASLPFIKFKKLNKVLNNNNSIEQYTSKNKTINPENNNLIIDQKCNSQKKILLSKNILKQISDIKSTNLKNKNKQNLVKYHISSITNKSCIFFNKANYFIDPELRKNYLNYEKLKLNSNELKRRRLNNLKKHKSIKNINESMDKAKMKTIFNYHSSINKDSYKRYIKKIKLIYKNSCNNSLSLNSFSLSKTHKNIKNNSKEDGSNNNNVKLVNLEEFLDKKYDKTINNYNYPYYTPLTMIKKEKYKIYTGEEYYNEKVKNEQRIKELNKINGLNEFGYPLEYNKNFNENISYKNDYLKVNKDKKYFKDLVENRIKKTNKK